MLKTVLETLDGVNDAIKPFYTEKDDKFYLQIDGVREHPDVANLKTAFDAEKAKRQSQGEELATAKAKIATFPDDFDADVWAKAKDGKADDAKIAAVQASYEAKLAEKDATIKEKDGEIEALKSSTTKAALERDLSDLLTAGGVTDPAYLRAARLDVSARVSPAEDGTPMVDTPFGPKPLAVFVPEYLGDEGKSFVTPAKGGDGPGGKNKGGKKFSEMTGQQKVDLRRENPQEYDRLKAAG
jgi:hypothetical protein